MDVASGCGEQDAGVVSGSGCNLWVWLLGVVVCVTDLCITENLVC